MFSLMRCGISSILYSVSSRSKRMASIAGLPGEASGHDIFFPACSPSPSWRKTNALLFSLLDGCDRAVSSELFLRVSVRFLSGFCKRQRSTRVLRSRETEEIVRWASSIFFFSFSSGTAALSPTFFLSPFFLSPFFLLPFFQRARDAFAFRNLLSVKQCNALFRFTVEPHRRGDACRAPLRRRSTPGRLGAFSAAVVAAASAFDDIDDDDAGHLGPVGHRLQEAKRGQARRRHLHGDRRFASGSSG